MFNDVQWHSEIASKESLPKHCSSAQLKPSMTSWCARAMRFNPLDWLNFLGQGLVGGRATRRMENKQCLKPFETIWNHYPAEQWLLWLLLQSEFLCMRIIAKCRMSLLFCKLDGFSNLALSLPPLLTIEQLLTSSLSLKKCWLTSLAAQLSKAGPKTPHLPRISETSCPKVYPAPRGETPHPNRSSGSLQSRSHMAPSWGTCCALLVRKDNTGKEHPKSSRQTCPVYWRPCRMVLIVGLQKKRHQPRNSET